MRPLCRTLLRLPLRPPRPPLLLYTSTAFAARSFSAATEDASAPAPESAKRAAVDAPSEQSAAAEPQPSTDAAARRPRGRPRKNPAFDPNTERKPRRPPRKHPQRDPSEIRRERSRGRPPIETDDEAIPFASSPGGRVEVHDKSTDPFAYLYDPVPEQQMTASAMRLRRYAGPYRRERTNMSGRIEAATAETDVPSSITMREREIFTRIFDEILGSPPSTNGDGSGAATATATAAAPKSVEDLFSSVAGGRRKGTAGETLTFSSSGVTSGSGGQNSLDAIAAAFPPSLQVEARKAVLARRQREAMSPVERARATKARLTMDRMVAELKSLRTDKEVLEWAEREVWSLVDQLPTDVFGLSKLGERVGPLPKEKLEDLNAEETAENETTPTTTPTTNPGLEGAEPPPAPAQEAAPPPPEPEPRPPAEILYPTLLQNLLLTMRRDFADPSTALALFDRVKRLGALSYVTGASTEVYHEALFATWIAYRDLGRVAALLDEMRINGVQPTFSTMRIMNLMLEDAEKDEKRERRAVRTVLAEARESERVRREQEAEEKAAAAAAEQQYSAGEAAETTPGEPHPEWESAHVAAAENSRDGWGWGREQEQGRGRDWDRDRDRDRDWDRGYGDKEWWWSRWTTQGEEERRAVYAQLDDLMVWLQRTGRPRPHFGT